MSSSSLVKETFDNLPFRKSSYVRVSQNSGVTASKGKAAANGNNQKILFM